jgi:hypothetical protein
MLHVQAKRGIDGSPSSSLRCGLLSLLVLVCLGLCLTKSLTCLVAGGRLEGRVLRFGRWYRHAFFGVFGTKEIIGVLRI